MFIDFDQNINLESLSPQTDFEEKVISFLKEWYSESHYVSVQTSGSTGTPKVFEIEKSRMLSSAKMTCDFLNLKPGNTALVCLPVDYISGKMMIVRALERKLKLLIATPSSKALEYLEQEVDFCAMSPLQVENSLDKIHFIKNLIIGGAQVSESLKTKIHKQLPPDIHHPAPRIYETYGMSETLSHIALKQIYPTPEEYFSVFEGIEICLDERACLKISAPKLNPEILQTNDLIELKGENQFKFLGRIDNVINSGGLKIRPEELENLLKRYLHNEVAFLGIKDEKFGQKLISVIEGNEDSNISVQLELAFKEIEKKFSKNHLPKEIHFIPKFPRIPNGKINRKELLHLF
ncbi:AMP-binding protein [Chryseobacterium sp. HSC-36S06]|uniref:AMP-binding protein n=1 Tax=Chryseobacterium sp. HSC-36S06 TaxID=2910970 RepID=UPI0020A0F082|nr:AMP-binding protein [Chryseobacterium sp. HSC-36S06]MCP2037531.1 O-succinylbenzoic acid--CoA ligase [Chryseobacterium sp. HSC-36S06]